VTTAAEAILVLPHLRVQNANAISSPLTHGFPAITAFMGLKWALERKLAAARIPLRLHGVGVICHAHQEQVAAGYVKTFRLTRNPVGRDGQTAAIVEEGRVHLLITLVFSVSEKISGDGPAQLIEGNDAGFKDWAEEAGRILARMRVAGGALLPSQDLPGRSSQPWLAILPDDAEERQHRFKRWRRRWLPGYALIGRDDLLTERLNDLREEDPQITLLDAWLHASRLNLQAQEPLPDLPPLPNQKIKWADPWRGKGSGWIVPIPVGYAALSAKHAPGAVRNARDATIPLRFVESVYSLGEWIGPHRLDRLEQLLWHAQTDEDQGLYRCHNGDGPRASDEDNYVYAPYSASFD